MLSMILADVLARYVPGSVEQAAAFAGDVPVEALMAACAALIELPIFAMVLVQALPRKVARPIAIIVAVLCAVFIVGGWVALPHYAIIAVVELALLAAIVWTAWTWTREEAARA